MNADTLRRAVVNVKALYSADDTEALECQLVREDALTLDIEDVGHYTLMWTPTGALDIAHGYTFEDGVLGEINQPEGLALALGFCLSEGIIQSLQDLKSVAVCPDNTGVIRIQLLDPGNVQIQRRNVVINSSCGICGPREIIDDNALGLTRVTNSLRLQRGQFVPLMNGMREQQGIFERTGGSHAAAIFDTAGEVVAVAEDLGRHNALDKAIGLALLQQGSVAVQPPQPGNGGQGRAYRSRDRTRRQCPHVPRSRRSPTFRRHPLRLRKRQTSHHLQPPPPNNGGTIKRSNGAHCAPYL